MNTTPVQKLTLREGSPGFEDLPWTLPLAEWVGNCSRIEEVPRGLSRHPVLFINYSGTLFALKELPGVIAEQEFNLLCKMEELRLPVVSPVGYVLLEPRRPDLGHTSVLVTRYLDYSLPYRTVFIRSELEKHYLQSLLDAMAGLLVQLHLAGVLWGDCSLSNTLFRRDAGALQAYLVDAETGEAHPPRLSPMLRHHDLEIMEENVDGEVTELLAAGAIVPPENFSVADTGAYIRHSYQRLWEAITREQIIHPSERYRIQEHIRTLNALGFSVGGIEMQPTEGGDTLRLRVMVTDRNFHQDLLFGLTGLQAEERQARLMMNEIQEVKASISQANNRSTPLSVAAFHWLEHIYQPVVNYLDPLLVRPNNERLDTTELYCQVLEHKWYLSERAQRDVGHQAAVEDYLENFYCAS